MIYLNGMDFEVLQMCRLFKLGSEVLDINVPMREFKLQYRADLVSRVRAVRAILRADLRALLAKLLAGCGSEQSCEQFCEHCSRAELSARSLRGHLICTVL